MSTLTALKLERELELTRRAMTVRPDRPKLERRWLLDAETGRPVAVWTAVTQPARATVMPEPAFA